MQNYELTERGKIIIAIILVILIFVVPSIYLVSRAWVNTPSPETPVQTIVPGPENPPVISNGPLPEGSGLDPTDDPEDDENGDSGDKPENGEQGSFDPPDEPPEDPPDEPVEELPVIGPISLDRAEGTMAFNFSPTTQDSLDEATVSMLSDFITSPRNTRNSQIVVEVPRAFEADSPVVLEAISKALAPHGVKEDDIIMTTYRTQANERSFEVRLSFRQNQTQTQTSSPK